MALTQSMKTHVAVLPSLGLGHVTPLLELAKRLVIQLDCRVSFLVITTNEHSAAQDQLLRSPSLPPDLDIVELPLVDVSTIAIADDKMVLTRLCLIVKESLKSLESVLVGLGKPQALVIDLVCTEAFEVCRELSIPTYSFFTSSAALLTFSLYLPTLEREVEGEFVDLPEPVDVPGCTPIRIEDLLEPIRNRKIDECNFYLLHLSRLPLAAGIFLNSWEDLEPIEIKALAQNPFFKQIPTPPVHSVGPLIKQEDPLTAPGVELLAWLDKQPPESVLFVTLGSGGTLSAEQLTELALGLELSHQRFVFVVRKPSDGSAASTFFNVGSDVNDPNAYLPEGFQVRTQDRGLIVRSWAPQVMVLKHASTGGFLSHCGWNSTLESIAHGVPIIAWPLYAEQRMNATMLAEEIRVAIKPAVAQGKKVVGREEIVRVVRMVMEGLEGKKMREKAKELKTSAAEALRMGGSSYDALARVANEWKQLD